MDSSPKVEAAQDLHPFFRVYKDGRVERFVDFHYLPPSEDPKTGVKSKDVVISTEVSARIFLPRTTDSNQTLPIIIYTHGGAFVIESAFSSLYHSYCSSLAAEANAILVSVEYRLAPEHPIPACYDDSWTALKWVTSHANSREGPEPWINDCGDFSRVFLAGDSAGANIAHNLMVRAKADGELVDDLKIVGMVLVHPYFSDGKPDKLWAAIGRGNDGSDDQLFNPMAHLSMFTRLGCCKVLVCAAGEDSLKDRGLRYHESLKNSNWGGKLEFMEIEGEGHCFHLKNPTCEKANILMERVVSFIN